ncbi:MAG: N-acetyltransferase [Pseudomonadota bacterium]
MLIRISSDGDRAEILALYPLMFPDEELRPMVSELLDRRRDVLSLVACASSAPVAHLLFTLFDDDGGALLGPLGVRPDHQGQGVGSTLVDEGLARLSRTGVRQVFVLGDPNYYGRFGFTPERGTLPPYPLPPEWADAWQSVCLAGRQPMGEGPCVLPDVWMKPELWGP